MDEPKNSFDSKLSSELNNNNKSNNINKTLNNFIERIESATGSSASSYHSDDSSEDVEGLSGKASSSIQEFEQKDLNDENSTTNGTIDNARSRSKSDGATGLGLSDPFEVFPSLPDSVLEKLGLLETNNEPGERLSEEEQEQKFITLALAFNIDATTIKDRCERQRRYRDQTEKNLTVELERLIQKANRIQPLCIDAETTELLSVLLSQIDIVMRAAALVAISSERYGAVQQEERLAESVKLMISHVNVLKKQRDSARRQLQYTKRVLQNSNSQSNIDRTEQRHTAANHKDLTRRRASIATISRQQDLNKFQDIRKMARRTSDLSIRASSAARGSRPSRLELGVDLVKIKEGMVENELNSNSEPLLDDNQTEYDDEENNDIESIQNDEENSSHEEIINQPIEENFANLPLRVRLMRRLRRFQNRIGDNYSKWTDDGTIHEICCFCALLCFSISIITMANILIEAEFSKRGLDPSKFFWYWTS